MARNNRFRRKRRRVVMLARLRNSFFTGIAITFPILFTIAIVKFMVVKINETVLTPLLETFGPYLQGGYALFLARSTVFILVIVVITFIGFAARLLFLNKFFEFWERFLTRVPMVGKIYTAIKQISNAFLGQGRSFFQKVVLLEYPRKGLFAIGFVTSMEKGEVERRINQDTISVFVPTAPNPTSGFYLSVPRSDLRFLDMSVEEAFKLIISSGAIIPEDLLKDRDPV